MHIHYKNSSIWIWMFSTSLRELPVIKMQICLANTTGTCHAGIDMEGEGLLTELWRSRHGVPCVWAVYKFIPRQRRRCSLVPVSCKARIIETRPARIAIQTILLKNHARYLVFAIFKHWEVFENKKASPWQSGLWNGQRRPHGHYCSFITVPRRTLTRTCSSQETEMTCLGSYRAIPYKNTLPCSIYHNDRRNISCNII